MDFFDSLVGSAPEQKEGSKLSKFAKTKKDDEKTLADTAAGRCRVTITIVMKRKALTFNRNCGICGKSDRSPCPLDPQADRLWGYYRIVKKNSVGQSVPAGTYGTEGGTCYFCLRVWNASFMELCLLQKIALSFARWNDRMSECVFVPSSLRFTLTAYKKELGKDEELHRCHNRYLHWLIQRLVAFLEEGKSLDDFCKLVWPSPTLRQGTRNAQVWRDLQFFN